MTLYGYCYYNKKVGAYSAPQFLNIPKDIKLEADVRSFHMAKDEDKVLFEENDLYYLGTFNDVTGSFEFLAKPEFLCGFNAKENNNG